MAKKKRGRITVLEAVDNLSHLADLDVEKKEETEWTDPAKLQENQDAIRETFRTLTAYLQHLCQKERDELGYPQMQKGIQAMMQLAGEAVEKVGNPNVLVNLVSRRVRQLNSGGGGLSRPLVDAPASQGVADIALREIIEEKIGWELPEVTELVRPQPKKRRKR